MAAALPQKPFVLALEGSGHFGDLWWVGIRKQPALTCLAQTLQENLRQQGFSLEKRAFRPHITIARRVAAPGPVLLQVPPASMVVECMSLMKSERIAGKLTYTPVARCMCSAADGIGGLG